MDKREIAHIAVEVNNSCNQKCIFCYNHIPHVKNFEKSSYSKIKRLLKYLFSQAKIHHVTFTGGEPLLEPRLSELILFCRMNKASTTIISNGTLFNDETIENLTLAKNDLFQLPIHSANYLIHDQMTGLNGSHSKSTKAISDLLIRGANVVAVIVLTKDNVLEIKETINYILSLGIKQISVDRYNIGGENIEKSQSILPELKDLQLAYKTINNVALENQIYVSSNVCTPHCILNPQNYPHIRFGNCASNPLQFPLTVDILGNLRVCNHSPVVAGNVFKDKVFDILNSEYVNSWNKNIPEICNDCKHWTICRGGCRAASEQCGLGNKMHDPVIDMLLNLKQ